MARISAIADTGFVVGALDVADQWHGWAAQQFSAIGSPALTCEAVISEACLVRLSELHRHHVIVTTDAKDFRVYRRFRREALPLLTP